MDDLNNGGPIDDRGCTDILCCLFFLLFIFAEIVIAGISFSNGKPDLLLYPYDEDGNPCGKKGNKTENFKYLYLYNALSKAKNLNYNFTSQGICVSECPSKYPNTTNPSSTNDSFLNCTPTVNNPNCKVTRDNLFLSEICKYILNS